MPSGMIIKYGKYKGKTIEEIHFIDYGWIQWMINKKNALWLADYIKKFKKIYPDAILVKCGSNHHAGCKEKPAVRASFPTDNFGKSIIAGETAYYWCGQCDIHSADADYGMSAMI